MTSGVHTIRRLVNNGTVARVSLENGSFTNNFQILSVQAFFPVGNADATVILSTNDVLASGALVTDNRQFGWIKLNADGSNTKYIDPGHIIVDDYFIHNLAANPINVVVEMLSLTTTDAEAALYMIKERAQGASE